MASRVGALVVIGLLLPGCDTSTTETTPSTSDTTSTTPAPAAATLPDTTTSTTSLTTTTAPGTTEPPEVFHYAVIAEEDARRLAVVDPNGECVERNEVCFLAPVTAIELGERPHNMTSVGTVVYATHPAAGSISRADVAAGTVMTAAIGEEPHDIEYHPEADVVYITDESGRALLTLDPETLEVLDTVELPGEPHDLALAGGDIWVTLIGHDALARVRSDQVELFTTGGSPHDLIVDGTGMIWFSNWNSEILNVFNPETATTERAPAGVSEPHHFALDADGSVWVSDNGGSAVVGFTSDSPVTVEVGPVPHHLVFVEGLLVVAVSGGGEAVFIDDEQVVARAELTTGLHGVTEVSLESPLPGSG